MPDPKVPWLIHSTVPNPKKHDWSQDCAWAQSTRNVLNYYTHLFPFSGWNSEEEEEKINKYKHAWMKNAKAKKKKKKSMSVSLLQYQYPNTFTDIIKSS